MGEGKSVSLVLGSGGARGLAHVGVLRWLDEHGYHIRSIAGSSMGALVGGVYAAGRLDEYEAWARAVTRLDMVALMDLAWSRSGLLKGDRVINTLKELVGDVDIEALPVRYTAVASDVRRQREVWLQQGPLFNAIRASISLPVFFTPYRYQGIELIDGGVLNPVPIAPTFRDTNDLTIAVDASGSWRSVDIGTEEDSSEAEASVPANKADSPLHVRLQGFIDQLTESFGSRSTDAWSAYDIVHDAFDAMQSALARQQLGAYPPDVLISIPRNLCKVLEFYRAGELIEYGYLQTDRQFQRLRS